MRPFIRTNHKSPILDLPDDLTYLIFLTCHHDDPQNFSTTILRVCNHWRQTALAISELWSTINFDKDLRNKRVVERIQLQLERAQLAPLQINIFGSAVYKPAVKNMLKICQLILPLVRQWGSLTIHGNVSHRALGLLFDRLTNTLAPWLEKLTIEKNMVTWSPDMGAKWKFNAFRSGMPSLRHFQLSICRPNSSLNSHIFGNLIELEIQDPRLLTMNQNKVTTIVRNILVRSPRLRRLVVNGDFRHDDLGPSSSRFPPPPIRDAITHSAIECLNIPLCRGAVTDALLHFVEMPSLEELTGEPSYYILPFSFHTLAHVNRLPNIRSIRIHGYEDRTTLYPQESADLPLALQAMHRLETLDLHVLDLSQSDSWLPTLLVWLPRLTWLEFIDCGGLSTSTIREMVDRGRNPKRLTLALYSTVKAEGELIHSRSSPLQEFTRLLRSHVGKLHSW